MKITYVQITRLFILVLWLGLSAIQLQAQGLATPRVSPPAELKQTIGLTEIVVNYARPKVIRDGQDRTGRIWGQAAWYGFVDAGGVKVPWRAGANENTLISFSDDVKIRRQDTQGWAIRTVHGPVKRRQGYFDLLQQNGCMGKLRL